MIMILYDIINIDESNICNNFSKKVKCVKTVLLLLIRRFN